jgi:hypothetical protein
VPFPKKKSQGTNEAANLKKTKEPPLKTKPSEA